MEDSGMFKSIEAILEFALTRERESQDLYLRYAAKTDRQGLRSLLLTMADQERWHEQSLRELLGRKTLEPLFSIPPALDLRISEYTITVSYHPEMNYQDFLLMVIQKEEKSQALYARLESLSADNELKFLFKGLAEEERRHKALAQDRYDLEILTEN